MNPRVLLGGLATGAFLTGLLFGCSASYDPTVITKTRTVKLPPVTVTKTVTVPSAPVTTTVTETVTKYVVPDGCDRLVENTNAVVKLLDKWSVEAKDYYADLDAVSYATLSDPGANSDLVIRTHNILDREDETLYSILLAQQTLESTSKACKAAVESANN